MDSLTEMVHLAQTGNQDAMTQLVDMYHQPALRVAQNILGSSQEGEDAVQEAWIVAVRNLHTLRDAEKFNYWLYRIVKNIALRQRQKKNRMAADIPLLEEVVHPDLDNETDENLEQWLPMAINALSSKDYFVTSLHYYSQLSVAEIGQLLDIPPGTVKSRLFHAKSVLRKEIKQMMKQEPVYLPDDFRKVIGGMRGEIRWTSIFDGDLKGWSYQGIPTKPGALRGTPITPGVMPEGWSLLDKDGLVGEEWKAGTSLIYGEASWRDLEFSLLITPIGGGNAQVLFRLDEAANRYYVFDMLMGWQAVAIRRITYDEVGNLNEAKLDVVNYPLRNGTEYAVTIAIRDQSITTYINGALVNRVTDGSWYHGKIGLTVWQSKTLYRDIQVRLMNSQSPIG
jgi:RNA polymerase sigma-70 factor (ECF subfamily)